MRSELHRNWRKQCPRSWSGTGHKRYLGRVCTRQGGALPQDGLTIEDVVLHTCAVSKPKTGLPWRAFKQTGFTRGQFSTTRQVIGHSWYVDIDSLSSPRVQACRDFLWARAVARGVLVEPLADAVICCGDCAMRRLRHRRVAASLDAPALTSVLTGSVYAGSNRPRDVPHYLLKEPIQSRVFLVPAASRHPSAVQPQ